MDSFSLNNNDDSFFYQVLLYVLFENEQQKWDSLRNKEKEIYKTVQNEYNEYFQDLFRTIIPTYSMKQGTSLYRARCIKSTDTSKLGVNISDVLDSFYKIILSEEEIYQLSELNKKGELNFSLQHLFMLKSKNKGKYSDDEQRRIDSLIHDNSIQKTYGFNEKDSRVPPRMFRKAGRLNTASDAFLYVAFDRDTAIHEMRPSIGQQYSLAEFRLNKNVNLADLTGNNTNSKEHSMLTSLASKISEPNTDNDESFYHITQHMAHVIKEQGYDGILYQSALCKGKNNILLFDESVVDYIASEITEIQDVHVSYVRILPFSNDIGDQLELSLIRRLKDTNYTIEAYARITPQGILVLKGSKIAPYNELLNSLTKENQKRRKECQINNNVLQEDILFNSPSGAAQFVIGKNANGNTSWKTKDGKLLKDIISKK